MTHHLFSVFLGVLDAWVIIVITPQWECGLSGLWRRIVCTAFLCLVTGLLMEMFFDIHAIRIATELTQ